MWFALCSLSNEGLLRRYLKILITPTQNVDDLFPNSDIMSRRLCHVADSTGLIELRRTLESNSSITILFKLCKRLVQNSGAFDWMFRKNKISFTSKLLAIQYQFWNDLRGFDAGGHAWKWVAFVGMLLCGNNLYLSFIG